MWSTPSITPISIPIFGLGVRLETSWTRSVGFISIHFAADSWHFKRVDHAIMIQRMPSFVLVEFHRGWFIDDGFAGTVSLQWVFYL